MAFGAIGSALGLAAMFALNAAIMPGGAVLSQPRTRRLPSETP